MATKRMNVLVYSGTTLQVFYLLQGDLSLLAFLKAMEALSSPFDTAFTVFGAFSHPATP